jgi:hypothetical protein
MFILSGCMYVLLKNGIFVIYVDLHSGSRFNAGQIDWLLLVCEKPCGWSTSLSILKIGGGTDVLAAASCTSRLVVGALAAV